MDTILEFLGSSPSAFAAIAVAVVAYLLFILHFKPKMEELDLLKKKIDDDEKSELSALVARLEKIEAFLQGSEDSHRSILSQLAKLEAELSDLDKSIGSISESIDGNRSQAGIFERVEKLSKELPIEIQSLAKALDRSPVMDAGIVNRLNETLNVINSRLASFYMSQHQPVIGEGRVIK